MFKCCVGCSSVWCLWFPFLLLFRSSNLRRSFCNTFDILKMQVIKHPVERLHTALLSTQKDLIKTYQKFSRAEKTFLEDGLLPGNSLFSPITIHSDSDWIPAHPEDLQDFQSFYINPYRRSPNPGHKTIYIQTIGSFGEGAVVAEQYVEWMKDYCQAFFYGLVVKLLPPVTVASTACSFRVNNNTHNLQLHAGELLNFLKKRKPRDAFCIVGITMIDLYPKESWNFVFGQASLTEGMGVFSFSRYDDHFYERSYAGRLKKKIELKQGDYSVFESYYTPPFTSILLLRSCKTLTHEIGHIFGMEHCQWLNCVMQGSNHLVESDRRTLVLCPICLRKLQSAIGFKIADRYKAILHWSFYINPYRRSPNPGHKTIYIQTIGSFGEGAVVAEQYVEWMKDYCQAFFYGLVVKLLPPVTVASTACSFRVNNNTHNLQLHAGELLNFLKKRKPRDAFCIVGITMIDLYPKESWNFVFGQASLTEGMGVFSFSRYDDHFYERSYAGRLKKKIELKQGDYSVFESYYTPPFTSILLLRSCKTLTHEIGHIFGMEHCQWLNCVMQGSNHLVESDRRTLVLCPICLRKLQSAIGFKIADRYKAILHWIEDGTNCNGQHSKPTQAFQEYKDWLYKCLQILESETP